MSSDPATTAFVAFCRTGKPELLGEVFDRLAPELMLVAARLLGRGGDAPDVVQQTFLTALQQRRRFDPQRPVAPWLVGILVQHVRRERRRLRRRLDARRLRRADAEDPLAAAASRDEAEAIRRAVAGMPQPYRQVLQLHLVHGLPPSAVAVSLERPFRTVQSQLRRGLQQLRKTLPPMALVPATGRTLELVRADVLHAAASCFGFLLLPWLKLAGLLAMALPLCALAVAAMAKGAAASAPVPTEQPLVARTTAEPPVDLRSADHAAAEPLARQLVQDPEPVCRVSLQILRAEDQTPLVGAHVTATVQERDAAGHPLPSSEITTTTDEHGMAVVELPRGHQRTAQIQIAATTRIAIGKTFDVPNRDTFTFLGLLLWQARAGRIRVRDQDGTPVPFLDVTIGGLVPEHGFMDLQRIRSATDEQGWTSTMELPLGDKRVCLHRVPVEFGQGTEVDLPLSLHGGDHELKLERPDPKRTIRGRVLDPQDQPLPESWVELLPASDDGPRTLSGRMPCDGDGRFVLRVPPDEPGPFRIRAGSGMHAGQIGEDTCLAGATDVVVRVKSPDGLALRVVDARTGEPVEDFTVTCLRVHADQLGWITGSREPRVRGHHPGGNVLLDNVEAGDNRLLVLPEDEDTWLPSGYLPVHIASDGVTRLTIKLHRPALVRVRVSWGDGTPVSGSRVRLRARLLAEDPPWTRDACWMSGIWDVHKSGRWGSTHWGGRLDLAMAMTDGNGIAELAWQPWHEPVVVRADGPGHVVSELELPGIDPGREPVELRVGRGATITGTVSSMNRWRELMVDTLGNAVEWGFDRLQPCVVLRNCADGLQHRDCVGRAFPVSADGTFICRDVPPGRWQVLFEYDRPYFSGVAGATVPLLLRPLAEVVAMPGKEHAVAFALGDVLPGTLHGRLLLDGEPRVPSELTVRPWGRDHLDRPCSYNAMSWQKESFVNADGTYHVASLSGDIELEAVIDDKHYRLFERIPLAPGEHKEIDLCFKHLVARIQLAREDGTPITNRVVRAGEQLTWVGEDGWGALDPVMALEFEVELVRPGIERSELKRLYHHDPRLRTDKLGHLALDPAQPTSEHRFVVREP